MSEAELDVPAARRRLDRAFIDLLERVILGVSRSWLLLVNTVAGLYVGPALLAPALMAAGQTELAGLIYFVYHGSCHQMPSRSFFVFGPSLAYTRPDLSPIVGDTVVDELVSFNYAGDALHGFKTALCQRDVAAYLTVFFVGLAFYFLRARLKPLSWKGFGLMLLPAAIDGISQLLGWRESTWELRTMTGVLAGVAGVWLLYPHTERIMHEVYTSTIEERIRSKRGRRDGSRQDV